MMRRTTIGAAALLLVTWAAAVPASAQNGPLTSREVVGTWLLHFLPSERRSVTVRGRPEMSLTVAARGGALACILDDEPVVCAIRNGALVFTWRPSGAAMTFTMSGRTRDGLSGNARVRAPLLPVSSDVGPVAMVRAAAR
jgi:hypothetical protein